MLPKALVLDLLSAVDGRPIPVRALVRAAEVFGITANNLRVALARLVADGKVERNERGLYGLAAAAQPVQRRVSGWSQAEDRVVDWRGGWVAAKVGSERARAPAHRTDRALGFLGMRELVSGLYVRPDNLVGGVAGVREQLRELGLPADSLVFLLSELDDAGETRARQLWDAAELQRAYQDTSARLEKSGRQLEELPLEEAIVECFVLGGHAIRQLAFDPLLPEPIVDTSKRRELVEQMRRYDEAGRRVWRSFMLAQGAPALKSLLSFRDVGRVA